MHPGAEDNYGLDACSITCLHSKPPVVVMATTSGQLYHCIVLESSDGEDSEEEGVDKVCKLFLLSFQNLFLLVKIILNKNFDHLNGTL